MSMLSGMRRVGAAAGGSGYDNRRKIFGIFMFYSLGALSASRSVSLAGGARQQPSCHHDCTGGAELSASTRIAPHWTSQRQPTHNDDAAARRQQARRSLKRSRTQRTLAAWAGASAPSILARPAPSPCPQPFLHVRAATTHSGAPRLTGDLRTGGRTTRSPVHGCLPPLSKGCSRGPGRGRAVPQHIILRLEPASATRVYLLSEHIWMWTCSFMKYTSAELARG